MNVSTDHSSETFERVIQPGSVAAERHENDHTGPLGSPNDDWDGKAVDRIYEDVFGEENKDRVGQTLLKEVSGMGRQMTRLVLDHIKPDKMRGAELYFPKEQ